MIAVDWGTSSLRAYRLDAQGAVQDRRAAALGIMQVSDGKFAQALESQIGAWLADGEKQVLMSGMIGARQGWVEAPYCECPAGFTQIAARLKRVTWNGHEAWIAPGVSGRDRHGVRDVMRGEELQILGSLDRMPGGNGLVCLPGTHSKWAQVEGGCIRGFSTHMTGEVFAVLRQHSILGRMLEDGPHDPDAFRAGVARAREEEGLLHHLFGVRARGLFGELDGRQAASYLSGILIGHEIAAVLHSAPANRVFLLGTAQLMELYESACREFHCVTTALDPEAAVKGLYLLSREIS